MVVCEEVGVIDKYIPTLLKEIHHGRLLEFIPSDVLKDRFDTAYSNEANRHSLKPESLVTQVSNPVVYA